MTNDQDDVPGQVRLPPGALIIRDHQEHDIEAIVNLALESLTWHADTFTNIRPPPERQSLRTDFRGLADTPDTYFRVAELDTAVVGFLTASLLPATTGGIEALDHTSVYISDIIVTTAVRRRGIARALLTDLEQWAVHHDCHTIRLNMHAGNAPAMHLYEQLGYQPTSMTFRRDIP
jgi:ribosomal protein S18 acetylase RimI-like enzyme